MILVDSCVWIDYLKGRNTSEVNYLTYIEDRFDVEVCISGIIYFEVLRGIPSSRQRREVANVFKNLQTRDYSHELIEKILQYDISCRKHGVTLSKLGDWLIVLTALEHNLEILTSDKDFKKISPYVPIKLI